MTVNFRGYVFQDDGDPVSGATVQVLTTDTTSVVGTATTTDSDGEWAFSGVAEGKYDIKITSGTSVRYIRWDDQISLKELDVRNTTGNTTPAATFTNLTDNASNQVAVFSGANATRADSDEIYLSFKLADSAGNIDEFARMTVDAVDVTSGEEDGQIRFSVSVDGTMTDVFTINSSESGGTDMTLDVSGDLVLDADGGDILFKDGGTTFGSATNTSGNLIIKSGTTTALTFSGADATLAGDLTISGDDLKMGTNTDTYILVADGTSYNPVAPSGVIDLANDGAFTLDNTVISSQTEITSGLAAADELLYSDGGTVKKIGLDNFVELAPTLATEDAIANGDYILFLDGGASGNMNKEAVHDLATLFAGSGLTATNSVIAVDTLNQDTSGTAAIATTVTITDNESTDEDNAIVFTAGGDVDGGNLGLESDGNLIYNPSTGRITATQLAGTVVTATQNSITTMTGLTTTGTIGTGVWNGTAITGAYINDDIISGQSEITSGLAAADELLYSDAGTVKRVGIDTLTTYLAGVNAGTVTSTGLSDSSGVISLDIQNMTGSTTIADADLIVIDDGAGGTLRKMTRANFIESAALDAINIDGGAIDGTAIGANSATTIIGTTIDATTDFTNGDTVITDGVITDSTGLQLAANLDIDGTADISGDLTLSGGADGALQFTNAGENSIKIPDNQASALIIEEANNAYITFVTTNSSEAITVAKATTFSAGIANSGTIAAGTWNGTDIGVAYGGTGASSLTDGGVLLGSGTSAVTAMAVLADSEMIVGDGTTDPVAESGATLRTSIGVGTGDSPQFTDLTLTDDLTLNSDSSVFNMGAGDDFSITHDGTTGATLAGSPITVNSTGALTLDSSTDIVLDADGDNITFKAGSGDSTGLDFSNSSGTWTIKAGTSDADIVFVANDGGTANEVMRIDASASVVTLGGNAAGPGELRILEDTDLGSHYTGFKAGNATASVSYVLPLADGSADQVLSTDGSGTLAWASAGGATQIQAYVYAMSV